MRSNKKEKMADDKKKYRWSDDKVGLLIDLFEERPCLWDIAVPSNSKRDVKEKALSEISETLGMDIPTIKAKWSSLRAQYRCESAKENKNKSGQGTDELYESKWIFFQKMCFVEQTKKNAKSNSTLQLLNDDDDDEGTHDNMSWEPKANSPGDAPGPSKRRKKTLEETKNALLSKCVGILEQPIVQPQPTPIEPFAVYISKQLESLDP